jgi:hypothetical protein
VLAGRQTEASNDLESRLAAAESRARAADLRAAEHERRWQDTQAEPRRRKPEGKADWLAGGFLAD